VPVDLFAPGVAQALVLLALRVGGLLLVAPAFSAKSVPVKVRTCMLLLFTLLLAPAAVAAARPGLPALQVTPAAFLAETLVGFAVGFGAAVLVGAAETAGDIMSTTIGLSGASLLDPLNGASSTVLAQFAQLFAVTVLLSVGGHVVMLDALAESVRAVPLGAPVDVQRGVAALVRRRRHPLRARPQVRRPGDRRDDDRQRRPRGRQPRRAGAQPVLGGLPPPDRDRARGRRRRPRRDRRLVRRGGRDTTPARSAASSRRSGG
jgi:hypothetical protein